MNSCLISNLKALITVLAMSVIVFAVINTQSVYAADGDEDSGVFDNVPWRITSNYDLIIGEEGQTYTFEYAESRYFPWREYANDIKTVSIQGNVYGNGSCEGMFDGCKAVTSLDLSNFHTHNVTNMCGLFYNCNALESLDLTPLDTSNVTTMNSMFSGCSSLTSLSIRGFDMSKTTDTAHMFSGCTSLFILSMDGIDTSNVINMEGMFSNCSHLGSLDVDDLDTGNVTNFQGMFSSCSSLTSLNVDNFDTKNATNMSYMFFGCTALKRLDVSGFDSSNVTDMREMFYGCSSVTELNVKGLDTSSNYNMQMMFCGCSSLESLDVSSFDTSIVAWMRGMFSDCSSLKSLDLSNFDTRKGQDMAWMFDGCTALETLVTGARFNNRVTYGNATFPIPMFDNETGTVYESDDEIPTIGCPRTYVIQYNGQVYSYPINIKKDTWKFSNPTEGGITYRTYQDMFGQGFGGNDKAWLAWKWGGDGEGGLCYGMAQTVLASHMGYPAVERYQKYGSSGHPSYLSEVEEYAFNDESNRNAMSLIQHAYVYQYSLNATKQMSKKDDLDGLYAAAYMFHKDGGEPVGITYTWGFPIKSAHELAVRGIYIQPSYVNIKVYDCNIPFRDEYITLYGTPGHFTSWSWIVYDGSGKYEEVASSGDKLFSHIQYQTITDDLIDKLREIEDIDKSVAADGINTETRQKRNSNNNEILIAMNAAPQGELSYNGETVNIENIYDSESESILPILVAAENGDTGDAPVMCWLVGDEKEIVLNNLAENKEVSVAGNEAVITAKSSSEGDLHIDVSDNSVQIEGEEGAEFTVSYDYVGEDTVKTVEVSGVQGNSTEIVPENEEVQVTGASNVNITETTTDLPQADPCAAGHQYGAWTTIKKPTYSAKGEKQRKCSVCGHIQTAEIAMLARTSIAKATISNVKAKTYTGKALTQKPTVKVGTKTLKSGTDYKLTYSKNKSVGTAKVTITGIGAYKDSKSKTFKINPKGTAIRGLTAKKKAFTVKWKKQATQTTGYQIQYSLSSKFASGNKIVTVSKNTTLSKTISKLKAKKKYYVRVRTYKTVKGTKYYSTWSSKEYIKTK